MEEPIDLTAIDFALLGGFFISYSVIGLAQLNALFNGAFIRFGVVAGLLIAFALATLVAPFDAICAEPQSAIFCNNRGRGLWSLAMAWTAVSAAVFGMFLISRLITRFRS